MTPDQLLLGRFDETVLPPRHLETPEGGGEEIEIGEMIAVLWKGMQQLAARVATLEGSR
jgi:hypothetical protein